MLLRCHGGVYYILYSFYYTPRKINDMKNKNKTIYFLLCNGILLFQLWWFLFSLKLFNKIFTSKLVILFNVVQWFQVITPRYVGQRFKRFEDHVISLWTLRIWYNFLVNFSWFTSLKRTNPWFCQVWTNLYLTDELFVL